MPFLQRLKKNQKQAENINYSEILRELENGIIDEPFIALGLRSPTGKGVWLFGERHDKETKASDSFSGSGFTFTPFDEMISKYTKDNILIFEGEFGGDRNHLAGAPSTVLDRVKVLLGEDEHVNFTREFRDEDGNIIPREKETKLEKLGYTEFQENENWDDPGYFQFLRNVGFYADVVQERFMSKRGVSINIDTNLRRFLISNFVASSGGEINEVYMFDVLNWWLESLIPSYVFVDKSMYTRNMYTPESYRLLVNLMRFVKHKYSSLYSKKVLSSITSKLSPMLKKTEEGKVELFKNIENMKSFASSYVGITMDLRLLPLIKRHPMDEIVTYTGAHHTIMFAAILQSSGYTLEHSFVNDKADYIIGGNRVENLVYDSKLDILDYVSFVENVFGINSN